MKNIKYKILLIFLTFFCLSATGQNSEKNNGKNGENHLEFDQEFPQVTGNSGENIYAYLTVEAVGDGIGACHFGISYIGGTANGYVGHDPANGALVPKDDPIEVEFTFNKTVTSDTTILYPFRVNWFDDFGDPFEYYFNIEVTYIGTGGGGNDCSLPAPNGVSATTIQEYSVVIEWNNVSENNGYSIRHRETNTSTWTHESTTPPNATDKLITGLEQNTNYELQIKTKCSNNYFGDYSPILNFTTLSACNLPAPTGLSTMNITDISADISWNPVSSSTGYEVELKQLPNGSYNVVYNGTNTSKTLTNLAFETGYRWRVRARCANGSYSQNWSSPADFTTLPECPEHLDITQDVTNGQSDVDDSEITLHATNTIFSGGSAAYDTGTTLSLKPGFHAEAGSTFRAFIDGCTPTNPLTSEPIVEEKIKNGFAKSVKIFPNPTHGRFSVESNEDILQWELVNQFGNLNRNGVANSNNSKGVEIDISSFPTGIYFLKIVFKDGTMIRKTVLRD